MNDRSKGKTLGPPPRWLHCPRKSSPIAGKFLAFKTPLDERYDSQVPEECTFTPSMLIASASCQKMKIGLWIDLTNTTRFYDKREVEEHGIKYIKLQCRGHGECPSKDQVNTFIQLCNRFIDKNENEFIGVHCTHGFNRTGFLIIAFLIESLSWSIEAAFHAFKEARPPGIYKQDYINELFKIYDDVSDAISAPVLPDWCNEPDDVDDDGIPIKSSETDKTDYRPPLKKRKEFHKKNPVFMEGVPGVSPVSDPVLISAIQQRCQSMCGWKGSGFPGSQPVSMDVNNMKFLTLKPYKVSWKADGTRTTILSVCEEEVSEILILFNEIALTQCMQCSRIFSNIGAMLLNYPYLCGRCPDTLKWKPANLNSVDFKLVITQRTGIGILPTKVGLLYVGGMNEPFAELKINKALRSMDKKIIECKYEDGQWVFMRERTDKSFPNAYTTAMGVCESIRNPVTTELLFHTIDRYRWRPPQKPTSH
ncbi:mRNA-capping enzyme-like [Uloborus diversus]|uniref:mRNA-capping enzyme-like n=1 Tax=Uloborus diversus TaxID=327109 RepID=UPI00240A5754|nr:mRNA-capping enzyme-like [Uloborus diversus]